MLMRFKLAIRNITRHSTRSLLSILMISGAIAAIVLFQGFSSYSLYAIKTIAAENQYGNMQIATDSYWNPQKETRQERMFHLTDIDKLKNQFPSIERTSGRISFFGLISNGDLSISAKMIGVDAEKEPMFSKIVKMREGAFFSSASNEVVVGQLLAKQLRVTTGDDITILTSTIDGIMNAMDLKVAGTFTVGLDEIDAQVIYLPLSVAQSVLDTDLVDIAVIKFNTPEDAEKDVANVNIALKDQNLFAKSWRDLAYFYRQVSNYFGVQNRIIESILLALMFLGILNTVSMTIIERTGEIGTLRSLGESRKEVINQFLLESFIISVIGILLGTMISKIAIEFVHAANIVTDLPGASTPFKIIIMFQWSSVFYSAALATTTAFFATLFPAIRASRMNIVDALRKNI